MFSSPKAKGNICLQLLHTQLQLASVPGALSPMYVQFFHMTFGPKETKKKGEPGIYYHVSDVEGRECLPTYDTGQYPPRYYPATAQLLHTQLQLASVPGALSPTYVQFFHMTFGPKETKKKGEPGIYYHVSDVEGRECLQDSTHHAITQQQLNHQTCKQGPDHKRIYLGK